MELGKRNYASVCTFEPILIATAIEREAFARSAPLFIGEKSGERKSEVNVCLDVNLFRVRRRHLR